MTTKGKRSRDNDTTNLGEYGLRFKKPEDHTNQKGQWQNVEFL
jgi:hypothetical protein